jgi:transcription elongation GreA/GreB family factor
MIRLPPKQLLRDELVGHLEGSLKTLERAHQASREAATHEEAKPENDKDTRALEQSYVARGQAIRIEELRTNLVEVRAMPLHPFSEEQPVALGALVMVEENDQRFMIFLAPHGGGTALSGGTVQVVTPRSPLGRALLGRRKGDDCEAQVGGRLRELSLLHLE